MLYIVNSANFMLFLRYRIVFIFTIVSFSSMELRLGAQALKPINSSQLFQYSNRAKVVSERSRLDSVKTVKADSVRVQWRGEKLDTSPKKYYLVPIEIYRNGGLIENVESNEIIVFVQPYRDNCVMYFNHMLYFEEKQYRTIENYSKYMDVLWFSFKVRDNKKEYHYEIRTSFRDIANSIEGREIKVKLYDYSNSEYKEIRKDCNAYLKRQFDLPKHIMNQIKCAYTYQSPFEYGDVIRIGYLPMIPYHVMVRYPPK